MTYPWETRPEEKSRAGLVAALAGAGLAVAAIVVLAVLLPGSSAVAGKAVPADAGPPQPSPAPLSSAAPSSAVPSSTRPPASGRGEASPEAAAQAIIEAMNARDARRYAAITCVQPSETAIAKLQETWNKAGDYQAALVKPPAVQDATAIVSVRVTVGSNHRDTDFSLLRQYNRWCIPG
ncbi:hypothetical protein [Amycolatopsis suaedae]|uniref:DUF4878 domain-containing protein n=1 Tax=Amycolatopsis suaedae TaxID=2510978 RepID=A0A4Q7J7M7_9PSEU|nr:hypothetical protein [Amycolatopsis suaedae]RZQ63680.1 hypothetical protein EWH70_10890 [Amycolatopsis suaedae]